MSTLSDEYIKNFSKERKAIFNKRFSDDYDPNMSERSNIIRILNEMRELGLADGGRIGLREGLGSFETSDPKEAMKEVVKRFLEKNLETTTVPISENIFLNLGPEVSEVELGGIMKILGGELGFGASKDKGIGFNFKKEFNKGGRVAYQEGTDLVDFYTGGKYDAETANQKLSDLASQAKFNIQKGVDDLTGIGSIETDFPGSFSAASGVPSDFRHQAAANLLAETLGKGAYSDPILGPISYASGAIGSAGLGFGKEVIDLAKGLMDPNLTKKEAFSEFLKDNLSNIKGAFKLPGTTTEQLYDEIMGDYTVTPNFAFDPTAQIFAQRKKAIENIKNQRDSKPTTTVTGTTKPGTPGGRDTKPTTTVTGTTKPGTSGGFQKQERQTAREDRRGGQYGFASGGLARMLGE